MQTCVSLAFGNVAMAVHAMSHQRRSHILPSSRGSEATEGSPREAHGGDAGTGASAYRGATQSLG